VFTVSVHDQNTVSLPKLLNEAKIGKIPHCVMRWIYKQNTNMKLWKMCCFQRGLSYKKNLFFFSFQHLLDYIKFILHKFERKNKNLQKTYCCKNKEIDTAFYVFQKCKGVKKFKFKLMKLLTQLSVISYLDRKKNTSL
jgi:hypothetical protein